MSETEIDDDSPAGRWKSQILAALKIEKDWRRSGVNIVKRYREEDASGSDEERYLMQKASRFNILYANISVIRPSIYQNAPRPDVRRRYDPAVSTDDDPQKQEAARQLREAASDASTALERALTFSIDDGEMESEIRDSVDDMLIPGRGVLRARYDPEVFDEPVQDELGQPVLDEETGEPVTQSRIVNQKTWLEHVYWEDFLVAPARRWGKRDLPPWIAFRHLMTREECKESFGSKGNKIGLTWKSESLDKDSGDKTRLGEADRAEIWEVWNLKDRKVYWVAMGYPKILDEQEDPLNLEGFYPVPRPMYGIRTTNTLVPQSEYKTYEDLANELDTVQERSGLRF